MIENSVLGATFPRFQRSNMKKQPRTAVEREISMSQSLETSCWLQPCAGTSLQEWSDPIQCCCNLPYLQNFKVFQPNVWESLFKFNSLVS